MIAKDQSFDLIFLSWCLLLCNWKKVDDYEVEQSAEVCMFGLVKLFVVICDMIRFQ